MDLILDWLGKIFNLTAPTTAAEWLGQSFGILALICCFIMPLFKKKWQMLVLTALGNLFFALNYVAIGEIRTGMVLNVVAIVQVGITFIHLKKETAVSLAENIIFLALNIGLAVLLLILKQDADVILWLELLPLLAAVFNTLATFERDEQKTRVLTFINAGTYFTYYLILGMSSMFAELLAAVTCVIGFIRYRKK